jgi:HAD superfamily hydrolase (TIGR01490 family)
MGHGVAFVDLDSTLIDVNSGTLWARHEWRVGRLSTVDALRAAMWLGRYALGDDSLDLALAHAASLYKGMPEATMRDAVAAWFAVEVRPRVRPGGLAALAQHRADGERVVLASSTSQFAAACAKAEWGLDDTVSTVVEVVDGVLTGGMTTSAFGHHKLVACEAWAARHGVALADCTFYTDSYSDLALLEKVGKPVLIDPDRRLARVGATRGWPVVDWGRSGG